ncbi:hypothetical protein [Blastococcus atacamensis]|uniref:hypothetical protein n=1 Tax=Blastococcus atacamensis TaxID=2070508 RepID=UPI000CEC46CE|nr:hypothetical protein [Blastococcus atacamensis]
MTLQTKAPGPSEPLSPEAEQRRSAALVLGLVAAVVIGHVVLAGVPELAWGLAHLMPSGPREVLGAAVLPLGMAVATLAGERRLARGLPYPSWLRGLLWGCAATMVLLAPPPGRGDVGSAVRDLVPVFVYCTWGGFLLLAVGWFATQVLRGVRQGRDLRRGRPDLGPPPAEPQGWAPLVVRLVVTAAVPVALLAGMVAVGRDAGDPLHPTLDPVVVSVPALAGAPLEQQVSTVELEGMAALEPSMLADELTGGEPMDRGWRALLLTAPAPGVPAGSRVFLTVSELSGDADPDAARAQMVAEVEAEGGEPLPEGWLAVFRQSYGAAALDGRFLIVLEAGEDDGTVASRTDLMRTAVAALTPDRRAAVIEATDPASR